MNFIDIYIVYYAPGYTYVKRCEEELPDQDTFLRAVYRRLNMEYNQHPELLSEKGMSIFLNYKFKMLPVFGVSGQCLFPFLFKLHIIHVLVVDS